MQSNRDSGGAIEPNDRQYYIQGQRFLARSLDPALYLVATPIGNLGDITLRALETLAAANVIACEDTRTSGVLMKHFGISTPLTAYHEHNEAAKAEELAALVEGGNAVAVISDAGTPGISDPGYRAVLAARTRDLPVIALPGASALLTALVSSGLATDRFTFLGFPPRKATALRTALADHAQRYAETTLAYYESPRRCRDTLAAIAEVCGPDTEVAMARELTKLHETIIAGPVSQVLGQLADAPSLKGEIVVLVRAPALAPKEWSDADLDALLASLTITLSAGKAASEAARQTGLDRRTLYDRATRLKHAKD